MNEPASLAPRLAALDATILRDDPAFAAAYDRLVATLVASRMAEAACREGDVFPDFALASAGGDLVTRDALLAQGPLVLAFYRGGWCPYCLTTLRALGEIAGAIAGEGARLVAITGETGAAAGAGGREAGLIFPVLSDMDFGLALACGLVYRLDDATAALLRQDGLDAELLYGSAGWFLPIPATYVIGEDGIVRFAHVEPDFRTRAEPAALLRALRALRSP